MKLRLNWDGVGIATSLACAIHCAVLPLLASSLPLFGIDLVHNLYFEWVMICLAIAIGTYALYHGYIKHHRSFTPVIIFYIGCGFLIAKQLMHDYGSTFLAIAVILIVSAHYWNYRLCNRNKCSSTHHKH